MVHYVMKTQMLILCRKFAMTFDKRKWGEGGGIKGRLEEFQKSCILLVQSSQTSFKRGPVKNSRI